MHKCLCCQRPVTSDARYHPKCLKRLFDVPWAPEIPFRRADLPAQVSQAAGKISLSGAQIKTSIRLHAQFKRLEVVPQHGTHILKPEPGDFPELPQNENLCMNIAEALGQRVPPHGLFPMADGALCYVIRRFDRLPDGSKIHQEDMAQLLGLSVDAKYDGSLEKVGKAIQKHVQNVYLDSIEFFERVLLCFLIGNGDMHLKNWSLVMPPDGGIQLAPCYDFVSSRLYLPGEEESALTIHGKKNRLTRIDFEAFAEGLGIDPKAVRNVFEKFKAAQERMVALVLHSELSREKKAALQNLISARCGML